MNRQDWFNRLRKQPTLNVLAVIAIACWLAYMIRNGVK